MLNQGEGMRVYTKSAGFDIGPHGEIIPPPLVVGLTPGEAKDLAGLGEMDGLNDAMQALCSSIAIHQRRLALNLTGKVESGVSMALHKAVVEDGIPLSLRPLYMERDNPRTFAPILQRVGMSEWRVGSEYHGRCAIIKTRNAQEALRHARELYVEWSNKEAAGQGTVS